MTHNPSPEITGREKYWAFISYRHADNTQAQNPQGNRWADWLHSQLEGFPVPPSFIGKTTRSGEIEPRLLPCFKDEAELPTSADLGSQIQQALKDSRYLIVICSPRAVQSRYVNEEIRYFKLLGRGHRILPLIVAGEPNAGGKPGFESQECFPEALRFAVDAEGRIDPTRPGSEPIAADARDEDGSELKIRDRESQPFLEKAKLKLIAGLLGVGFDDLFQREQQRQLAASRLRAQRLRRLVAAFAVLTLLALGGAAVAYWQKRLADARKLEADTQKEQAVREGWRSRLALSRNYYDRAATMRDAARPQAALAYLVAALQAAPKAEAPPEFPTAWDAPAWPAEAWRMAQAVAATIQGPKFTMQHSAEPLLQASLGGQPDDPFPTIQTLGERDHVAKSWNGTTGAFLSEAKIPGEISSAHLDPYGARAILQMESGGPLLWDIKNNVKLRELPLPKEESVFLPYAFAFEPGNLIIGGSWTHLLLWQGETGELLWSYNTRDAHDRLYKKEKPRDMFGRPDAPSKNPDNFGHISALALSSDGKFAAFYSGELVLLLDVEKRQLVDSFSIGQAVLHTLIFLPNDSTQLILADLDRNVSMLDTKTGQVAPLVRADDFQLLRSASLDPEGKTLALTLGNGTVQIFDLTTGQERPRLEGHGIISARLPGPDLLLATTGRGAAKLFSLQRAGQQQVTVGRALEAVTISEDGKEALLSDHNYTARYDLLSEKIVEEAAGPLSPNLCMFTPDGTKAVHFSWKGHALLWDVATGALVREFPVLPRQVRTAEFTQDGSRLIVCTGESKYGPFAIWQIFETGTGREVLRLAQRTSNDVTFHLWADGHTVFTEATRISTEKPPDENDRYADDKSALVRIFDITTGEQLAEWEQQRSRTVASSREALAMAEPDGVVSVRSRDGKEICRFGGGRDRPAENVEFSPDGKCLALRTGWDNQRSEYRVEVYRIPSGEKVLSIPSPDEPQFKFSPDSSVFLAECTTGNQGAPEVHFVDLANGQRVLKVAGDLSDQVRRKHSGRVSNYTQLRNVCPVIFGAQGRHALLAHNEDVLVISLPKAEVQEVYPQGKDARTVSVATDGTGERLAVLCDDGTLRLYDRHTQKPLWSRLNMAWCEGVVHFAEGLVTITLEDGIHALRVSDGSPSGTLPRLDSRYSSDSWSGEFFTVLPSGLGIASGGNSGRRVALLKNLLNDQVIRTCEAPATDFQNFTLSPDGRTVLIGYNGVSELRDAATGALRQRMGTKQYRSESRAESTQGDRGWGIGRITDHSDAILETNSMGRSTPWPERIVSLNDLALSPDEQYLLAAHQAKLSLWGTASRQQLRELTGHLYRVNSARISADGLQAVSGSDDGSVFLWDLATGRQTVQAVLNLQAPVLERESEGGWSARPVEESGSPEKLRRVIRVGFIPGSGRVFAVSARAAKERSSDDDDLRLHLLKLTADTAPSEPATEDGSAWSLQGLAEMARLRVETQGSRRGEVALLHQEDRVPTNEEEAREMDAATKAEAEPVNLRERWKLKVEPPQPGEPSPAAVAGRLAAVRATLLAEAGKNEEALAAIEAVIATHPDVMEHRLLRLDLLQDLKRNQEALEQAQALNREFPGRSEIQLALAGLLENQGDRKAAAEAWLAAAQSLPKDGTPRVRAALMLAMTGRHADALKEAASGVALRPAEDRWSRAIQGWCLLMAERPEEARPILEVVNRGGSWPLLTTAVVTMEWKTGHKEEAVREYASLVAKEVSWLYPGYLATIPYADESCRQAIEAARKLFMADPDRRTEVMEQAEVHREKLLGPLVFDPWQAGDRSRAVANFEQMMRQYPQLGTSAESLKDYSKEMAAVFGQARSLAEKYAVTLKDVQADYPVDLGEGWAKEALPRWLSQAASEQSPAEERRRAWVNAGWLQFHAGHFAPALASWDEARKLDLLIRDAWKGSLLHLQAGRAMAAAEINDLASAGEALAALVGETKAFLNIDTVRRDLSWPAAEFAAYEKMLGRMRSAPLSYARAGDGYVVALPFPWLPIVSTIAGITIPGEVLTDDWDLRLGYTENLTMLRFGVRKLREQVNVNEYLRSHEQQELEGLEGAKSARREVEHAGGKWAELSIEAPEVRVVYRVQLGPPLPLEMIYVANAEAAKDDALRERTFAGFRMGAK